MKFGLFESNDTIKALSVDHCASITHDDDNDGGCNDGDDGDGGNGGDEDDDDDDGDDDGDVEDDGGGGELKFLEGLFLKVKELYNNK